MAQFIFFALFLMVIISGVFSRFAPVHRALPSVRSAAEYSGYSSAQGADFVEDKSSNRSQEFNVSTSGGVLQIYKQIDDLTGAQKELQGLIDDEEQAVSIARQELSDVSAQVKDKNDQDLLRLKTLGDKIRSEKDLLIKHGAALSALNDQIKKERQALADQSALSNMNTNSALELLQQHNASLKDQAQASLENTRDKIEEQRQKTQEQKDMNRQRLEDQMQRMKDQRSR